MKYFFWGGEGGGGGLQILGGMGTLSSLSTLVLQDYNLIWAVLISF